MKRPEPVYSDAQYLFWDIYSRLCFAVDAEHRYGTTGSQMALQAARDEYAAFCRDHPGQSFLVFRPEEIDAAFTSDLSPLFPHGPEQWQ